jgi:hypothetical protein
MLPSKLFGLISLYNNISGLGIIMSERFMLSFELGIITISSNQVHLSSCCPVEFPQLAYFTHSNTCPKSINCVFSSFLDSSVLILGCEEAKKIKVKKLS